MRRTVWTKKKATIALTLIAIIAVSSFMILFTNQTTKAALITPRPSGLVGWWTFDEGSGNLANDSSGNGNNGVINSAAWVDGKFGKALEFAGSSSVNCGHNNVLNSPNAISLSCWFKTSGSWQAPKGLMSKYSGTTGFILWVSPTSIYGGTISFEIWDGSTDHDVKFNGTITTDTWHYVSATFDGSTLNLYLDGNRVTTSSWTGAIPTTNYDFIIGQIVGGKFNGDIDDARVYNRTLSASDVQANFNGGQDFSTNITAKVPKGTTQMITTLSWQGTGSINATIVSPSQTYTEDTIPVYQKTSYSTTDGTSSILNVKRLSVSVTSLSTDQNWSIALTLDIPVPYQITVEVQK